MAKTKPGPEGIDLEVIEFLKYLTELVDGFQDAVCDEAFDDQMDMLQGDRYCDNLAGDVLRDLRFTVGKHIGTLHEFAGRLERILAYAHKYHHKKTVEQGRKSAHNKKMNEIDRELDDIRTRIDSIERKR